MLTAIIENESNTLIMEFPCKYRLIAEHLASIGIGKQANEIKCMDEEDEPKKGADMDKNIEHAEKALPISTR